MIDIFVRACFAFAAVHIINLVMVIRIVQSFDPVFNGRKAAIIQ